MDLEVCDVDPLFADIPWWNSLREHNFVKIEDSCRKRLATEIKGLQHTATHCNTLQHTATHCNTLQHTATHCNALQRTATYCNALQRTAIRSNTLHRKTLRHTRREGRRELFVTRRWTRDHIDCSRVVSSWYTSCVCSRTRR